MAEDVAEKPAEDKTQQAANTTQADTTAADPAARKERPQEALARMAAEDNPLAKELAAEKSAEEAKAADPAGEAAKAMEEAQKMPDNPLEKSGSEKWQAAGKGAPEKYDSLKLAAQYTEDGKEAAIPEYGKNELFDRIVDRAKELNLDAEQAQDLIDYSLGFADAVRDKEIAKMAESARNWREELKTYGLDTPEHAKFANTALQKIDPQGRLRGLMNEYGIYAMPEIMRGLSEYGRLISEGNSISDTSAGTPTMVPSASQSRRQILRDLANIGS